MQFIVLDMEWNQPWPGSYAAKKVLPVEIHGEIIQIGAVRMLEDQTVADELQLYVKPRYYRRLNKRVSKLTGIKESKLKAEGLDFPDAIEVFHRWCGDDCIFLTWGFDDIGILTENLRLFQLDAQTGEFLLLCSDGLSNTVTDQELLYEAIHGGPPESCCQRLLDIALSRGAPDNVTVLLFQL